jgi:hypothetical protein
VSVGGPSAILTSLIGDCGTGALAFSVTPSSPLVLVAAALAGEVGAAG